MRECSSIAALAGRASVNTVEHEIYLRSASVIFYSHWEGFVKRAATYYLRYLAHQRISIKDMSPFLMRIYVKQFSATTERSGLWEQIGERFLNDPGFRPKISYKNQIDTESNLSSQVFRKICNDVGISITGFESKLNKLDNPLLKNRNAVAHGDKGEDLNLDVVVEMKDLVISFITLFRDEIENSAVNRSFKVARV